MNHRFFTVASTTISQILIALAFTVIGSSAVGASTDNSTYQSQDITPTPELEPSDVVRIQVEALRGNGPGNEGIELTYRFASPGNKRYTGPLGRFTAMVRSAPYDRLLNHVSAEYGPLELAGDKAYQIVTITDRSGVQTVYLWTLSRQVEGEFDGCWMTDSVIPSEQQRQGQVT